MMTKLVTIALALLHISCRSRTGVVPFSIFINPDKAGRVEAEKVCLNRGPGWSLPDGQTHPNLASYLAGHAGGNIRTVWTSVRLQTLSNWLWVNNTIYRDFNRKTYGGCGVIKVQGNGDATATRSCSTLETNAGFICEMQHDGCPAGYTCIRKYDSLRGNYIVGCSTENWYRSRLICRSLSADLVILDSINKQDYIEHKLVNDKVCDLMTSEFFIGLRKEDWASSEVPVPLDKQNWMENEPSSIEAQCVVLQVNGNVTKWQVQMCSHGTSVVCVRGKNTSEFTRSLRPTAEGDPDHGLPDFAIILITLAILFIIVPFAVFVVYKSWQRRNQNRPQRSEELKSLLRRKNNPDENVSKERQKQINMKKKELMQHLLPNDLVDVLVEKEVLTAANRSEIKE